MDYFAKEDAYVLKEKKKLRRGFTTGSCAAAAAKAAVSMLFSGCDITEVLLQTPKGILLKLPVEYCRRRKEEVCCGIRKYSGDDPDVTDGIMVYAKVSRTETPGIWIEGGAGVGRVTKAGLSQKIGEAAINPVPMQMIKAAVAGVLEEQEYHKGIMVEISIPEGAVLAKKTFNPRLGIEGGISVLGTSGIVEPMSEEALKESIFMELSMRKEQGAEGVVLTPGNYGENFVQQALSLSLKDAVKCSNYIGEVLDRAAALGFKEILLVGHIGKFIKLAAGIMNTHSKTADARMEILTAHAALAGADFLMASKIMACVTTREALSLLQRENLLAPVMESIMEKIFFYLSNRVGDGINIRAVTFSEECGLLGDTAELGRKKRV